jgi:hypothetical protein
MNIPLDQPLLIIAAVIVAVVGVGRLSRVLTYDAFPPAAWVRATWAQITKDGPWSKLASCQWCATPWIMAFCLAWGWFSSLHWTWWVFWGWLAMSYASSILIARDEPE